MRRTSSREARASSVDRRLFLESFAALGLATALPTTTVTFVGQLFREAELLAVAKAFQDGTGFHSRHPRL